MEEKTPLADITAKVVAAYLKNNKVAAEDLPDLIVDVHKTFANLENGLPKTGVLARAPAVPINQSLGEDYLVCLEDGMQFQSLKRHLRSHHSLSPAQYREKWGLSSDYPMVAPNYSKKRSRLARASGLGQPSKK